MRRSVLLTLWVRSLSIQASFNYQTLQGLGFLHALWPLLEFLRETPQERAEALRRHLQRFHTHPIMALSVLGSVARLEEDGEPQAAEALKRALMGPYAAIGDVFFGEALRVLASVLALLLALGGSWMAPLALLAIHNPAQFWVRLCGFLEGHRLGKQGTAFIGALDLPAAAGRIRWLSLIFLGIFTAAAAGGVSLPENMGCRFLNSGLALAVVLCGWVALRKGLSQVNILYGAALLCMIIAF